MPEILMLAMPGSGESPKSFGFMFDLGFLLLFIGSLGAGYFRIRLFKIRNKMLFDPVRNFKFPERISDVENAKSETQEIIDLEFREPVEKIILSTKFKIKICLLMVILGFILCGAEIISIF